MAELPLPLQFLAAWMGTWIARRQERTIGYLKEENRVLLEKLGGRVSLTDAERRRLGRLGHELGRKVLPRSRLYRQPRYHPAVVAGAGGEEARRQQEARARPSAEAVRDRAVAHQDGDENPRWGYTRLRGALSNVGHAIGRTTIMRILKEQGSIRRRSAEEGCRGRPSSSRIWGRSRQRTSSPSR
jgi:hypothetical protein